jgi:putative phage-type endonuclease
VGLTLAQIEARRQFLGGTDAAALAGVNPPGWSQPIDVYLDKHGLAEPRRASAAMEVGNLLEDVVASLATAATGMRWRRRAAPVRHPSRPWMGGHLDRVAAGYEDAPAGHVEPGLEQAILECKTDAGARGWGAQGTTVVPLHYAVQVQHYLAVTRRPVAILAVLLPRGDFRWYRLERNEAMIANLMELEASWWQRHGPPDGVPPEPDGSESSGRFLRRHFDADAGEERVATPEQSAMLDAIRAARTAHVNAVLAKDAAEQRLMESMGDTARLVAPGATVTWRQNKDTTRVDWEGYTTELLMNEQFLITGHRSLPLGWPTTKKGATERLRELAAAAGHATTEPGARPFRVEFEDEEA